MVGMIQILTYMIAFYLIVKGIEILQIALASGRDKRSGIIALGVATLIGCLIAATAFIKMQDRQASSIGASMGDLGIAPSIGDSSNPSSNAATEAKSAADDALTALEAANAAAAAADAAQ